MFCASSVLKSAETLAHSLSLEIPSPLRERGSSTVWVGCYSRSLTGARLECNWSARGFVTEISNCVQCGVVAQFQVISVDRS